MVELKRKYAFTWDLLGDLDIARPNLGKNVRLEVYRLMQFCFRDTLEANFGTEKADELFYEAGELAGKNFFDYIISQENPKNFKDLVKLLQEKLKYYAIGILRVEQEDENGCTVTIAEDLDCSGLPELGYEVCTYDEGFLAGIFGAFTGLKFEVKETDCWCTGERTCRFVAKIVKI